MGNSILNGKTPYNDFFFAHPPLQVYTLALIYRLFGVSFVAGKMLTLIMSTLSVFLVYSILKELYDEKSGLFAAAVLLITPAFLSFSTIGYGMWETLLFVLLSVYLAIKNKLNFSAITFVIAILFRYLAVVYLPFLVILLYLRKQKFKIFLFWFFSTFTISILLLILIFGSNYIGQTILYQLFSKVYAGTLGIEMQYWSIGYFFLFLSLVSIVVAYANKDKILLLFASTSIIADMIILFSLKLFFYHYFLISLAFCIMAVGRTLIISKEWIIKVFIPIILLLAILNNIQTIDFYLNPKYAERYYSMVNLIENSTSVNDSIFGEPVATNYVSFVTSRKISSNYLDSYLQHLIFDDEQKVIENLEKNKPKIFIEMENYYSSNPTFSKFLSENYVLERKFEGIPNYSVYKIK
jgi:4-amino-4-deoxy-L-arabinose transferase-like glycosyltransferase